MDCDGSFDGNDLARVIEPVARGDADLVVGARQPTTPGAWPWHARLANRVLGAVSLLGPVRMDYAKAIRSVRGAAHELSRFIEEGAPQSL